MAPETAACLAVTEQSKLIYDLWQSAETQVRSLEISALTATGAIFSWLATRPREERLPAFAWWLPALITSLAGIRAGALGWRQYSAAKLASSNDAICAAGTKVAGWAAAVLENGPGVTVTAVVFYVALFAFNAYVACKWNRDSPQARPHVP